MSTRHSIYYENGVHIFKECLSEELCFDIDGDAFVNDIYDVPCIKEEQVKTFVIKLIEVYKLQELFR